MNEASELQRKRAVNMIWNAARNHSFAPDFKAYDRDGQAELYWNSIIGAAHRHYDYTQLAGLFASFAQYEDGEVYEGLLWLGLENCVYQKEAADRPILQSLREEYARRFVRSFSGSRPDDYQLYDCLALAHFLRVLGEEPKISRYDAKLLDELEFSPELTTEEIVERAKVLFAQWFQIRTEERRRERRMPQWLTVKNGKTKRIRARRRFHRFAIGFVDRGGAGVDDGEGEQNELRTRMTESELRAFMTGKFGLPLFSPQQTVELERSLCVGNHTNCHLHLTKGEPAPGKIQNGFEALRKRQEAEQMQKNRQYYRTNLAQNRTAIQKLAGKIQNSALLYLHPAAVKSNAGALNAGLVWRALNLDDDKVFTRTEPGAAGDLSVDILLDASTSQKNRQETVASQGYMIAEALTRCSIPCRVMSFCSMTGYTILRIFRDYGEPRANDRILDYVANGCNRDGLAIRAAHELMNRSGYEHKLLIILSDVKPNDILKIHSAQEGEAIPYEKEAGVNDTALEVRRARADGISVICVFTGEDEDLPAAKLVYGRDFARIQSLDLLADTVGMLIQNQIRNL